MEENMVKKSQTLMGVNKNTPNQNTPIQNTQGQNTQGHKRIKVIVTLGPATKTEEDLKKIKDKNADFVRINMSHSSIEDLKRYIGMAKRVGIPFIIDTEGSQVRTGELNENTIEFSENEEIKIYANQIIGDKEKICLKPGHVVQQLDVGDIIHVDFDTFSLRVSNISTIDQGYIIAKAITKGILGRNKAVSVDHAAEKRIVLPTLSEKDYQSIEVGLQEGVGHIAASFVRSGEAVDEVRRATQNTMKIISKVECIDALENLNDIIWKSDYILIDRGDLSKEIPVEKIPYTQKIIIHRAQKQNVGVFVATNLLETMIEHRKPTRAEVHDIIGTIVDGAEGLTLAAETAVGKHPMECINMLNKLIKHSELIINPGNLRKEQDLFIEDLERSNYLLDQGASSSLIEPHGGKLINRMLKEKPDSDYLNSLPKIKLNETKQMDVEQIAIGTYSPIEGFMKKEDLKCVLDNMKLSNGIIWPLPITLDVSEEDAVQLNEGQDVALVDHQEEVMAILHLEEKYTYDRESFAKRLYGTDDINHPGVKIVNKMNPILLGGKINLIRRRDSENKEYELTPKQTRRIFEERGWAKVVGFHTRNVIHRGHEFIQLKALNDENCDGLFVHPIIGKKKVGDYQAKHIIESYDLMVKSFYPQEKVVFGAFGSYSRYAGPREALFTALCRQNFGCSHFIVGRDHTGVGNYYHPKASHTIFERFPELGIQPVKFDKVFYSNKLNNYVHEKESENEESSQEHREEDKLHISGTEARKMFESGEQPPSWFMRPEISQMIITAIKNGEKAFVGEDE